MPVDSRLVPVDLHRAGRGPMHPGALVGLRLLFVDHRVLPVGSRLVLVDLHLHSPWLVQTGGSDKLLDKLQSTRLNKLENSDYVNNDDDVDDNEE